MKPDTTGGAWIWLLVIFFFPVIGLAIILFLILIYLIETIIEAVRTLIKGWW
jgi:hypothetical protein